MGLEIVVREEKHFSESKAAIDFASGIGRWRRETFDTQRMCQFRPVFWTQL